jgi:hypothetical protein
MPEQFTKNQHQHPRVSLRHFADKPEKDGKVWVFDKETMRWNQRSPNSIASDIFFYDFPEDEELHPARPQRVEKALWSYERLYGELSRDLIKSLDDLVETYPWNVRPALKPEQREQLTDYISMQILRTKEYRASQRQIIEDHVEFIQGTLAGYRKGFSKKLSIPESDIPPLRVEIEGKVYDEDDLPGYEEEIASMYQASSMFGPQRTSLSEILFDHIWVFGFATGSHSLYTSDSPVVKYGHDKARWWSSGGFASRGIEVSFPLSPRYLLMMYEWSYFEDAEHLENRVVPLGDEQVRWYNRLQVTQSYKQVCCRDEDFDLVREVCERTPDVRSPERRRWGSTWRGDRPDSTQ